MVQGLVMLVLWKTPHRILTTHVERVPQKWQKPCPACFRTGPYRHSASSVAMSYPSLLIATDQRGFANEHLSIFVTMSTGSGVGEQFALLQPYVQIDDIHDPLSASSRHKDPERAAEVLARNKKKLKSWQSTWLSNPSNLTVRAERQWGRDGWLQLQKILANIANTIELMKDADQGAEVEPDNVKFGRKLIRNPLISRHRKKLGVPLSQSPFVLDLALEIGHTIERLGIHSELLFESLHDIPADKHGSSTRDQQLSRSISARHGAVALYQACQRLTTKCELDLDLLRDRSMPSDPNNAPRSASDANPFYHILIETANDSNVGE